MPKYLLVLTLICAHLSLAALSVQDIDFLLQHADEALLQRYAPQVEQHLHTRQISEPLLKDIVTYARKGNSQAMLSRALYRLALKAQDLDAALAWLELNADDTATIPYLQRLILTSSFTNPADALCIKHSTGEISDSLFASQILELEAYNDRIEALAKAKVNEFAVERSDSLALPMIDAFEAEFPLSKHLYYGYFYRLYHLLTRQDYEAAYDLLVNLPKADLPHYVTAIRILLSERWLNLDQTSLLETLSIAQVYLDLARKMTPQAEEWDYLFASYNPDSWAYYLDTLQLRIHYLQLKEHFDTAEFERVLDFARSMKPLNNDFGQEAELAYMKGRILSLSDDASHTLPAARAYLDCLIKGAPRKTYDVEAEEALHQIYLTQETELDFDAWCRDLASYEGLIFKDMTAELGLEGKRFSRIAIADYDNDGWLDLLFDGKHLFRNLQGQSFEPVTNIGLDQLKSSGGLWADFNKDGLLDFAALSHASEGNGDALMKQQPDGRFVKVNERAGEIDDALPSEAAAWIDVEMNGYPSLYVANYEQGSLGAGTPDMFWLNEEGYFFDRSEQLGFRTAQDMQGLSGRGVAPADFNDDGRTDILVTNYRLQRNFLFVNTPDGFIDQAFQNQVAGHFTDGYYGHSIGADWGDYDNDGDLDLIICNLAHPRFIDFSDISMLLRNDGPAVYEIDGDFIRYHKFTDVTQAAGITYDELHSDPTWLDVDNDGYLDLYITSIYENDRSYLYHNNKDGTFTDVTWLSGSRVYNGWGNAYGDLNRDGLIDLVVASSSGIKVFYNETPTTNQALFLKPVWAKDEILLLEQPWQHSSQPNSPAFGTRVIVNLDGNKRLMRELNSAKGTCSQNAPELHFGIGKSQNTKYNRASHK
jgi:hypothetical protein